MREDGGWPRSAPPDEGLAMLRHCAEEALATDGQERTRLGYDVLVKHKGNVRLDRAYRRMDVNDYHD
jgi:hypothetical protein